MPSIIMRPTTSATDAINADSELKGIKIPVQSTAQIMTAGILADGVTKLEEAVRYQIPFVLDPVNSDDGTSLMPWTHQLHDVQMVERAKQILCRIYGKISGSDSIDDAELDFKAQRVVSHVKDQIIQHGLHLYSQKWLFDASRPLNDRLGLLKAIANTHFGARSATAAIASGLMPALPAYSTPDFLRMLDGSWRGVSFSVGNLREWIALTEPYLVEFPMPNVAAGKSSRIDEFKKTGTATNIILGLGFMLVTYDKQFDQYVVATPMLYSRREKNQQDVTYGKQYMLKSYTRVRGKEYEQLADLLRGKGRTPVFRLKACPKCGAICSDDRPDLAHTLCAN